MATPAAADALRPLQRRGTLALLRYLPLHSGPSRHAVAADHRAGALRRLGHVPAVAVHRPGGPGVDLLRPDSCPGRWRQPALGGLVRGAGHLRRRAGDRHHPSAVLPARHGPLGGHRDLAAAAGLRRLPRVARTAGPGAVAGGIDPGAADEGGHPLDEGLRRPGAGGGRDRDGRRLDVWRGGEVEDRRRAPSPAVPDGPRARRRPRQGLSALFLRPRREVGHLPLQGRQDGHL